MGLLVVAPTAALSGLVALLWDCDLPRQAHAYDRLLPSARAQLVINLEEDETRVYDEDFRCTRSTGTVLDGPASRSCLIDTAEQTRVVGVVFHAGAAAPFFRERMDALANGHVELDAIAAGQAGGLRGRLLAAPDAAARLRILEHWLLRRVEATAAHVHPAIAHALRLIEAAPGVQRIEAIAAQCRMSPRRFGELFREQVGMSPKRHLRLQRFHAALAAAGASGRVDWAGLAADGGFHDQAHLVHEFRAFSGMTPTAWMARRGEWQRHVALA
ncbi:helix-turn-helix domain-containing protein [Luteimonas sp. SDU101]|uniref:helix-turn-helix domain-containing protein n=1 Tax=Luteimonas sp. SDU101 TaxID=3422593 RepID=UPI003EC0A60D